MKKRCPFKTQLNKKFTSTFRDSDFHFFLIPEKNEQGSYKLFRGSVPPMYEWSVRDTLKNNKQYTEEKKDLVVDLIFDGVLQETLSDDLYTEYQRLLDCEFDTKKEALDISHSFYKTCMKYYGNNIFLIGFQKRKLIILNVIQKVVQLHMPDFVYVK
jgi:hypothetical protein